MRKRLLQYLAYMDALLRAEGEEVDWEEISNAHLRQLAFFQHERLAHLIVTMTVALLTLISVGIVLLAENLSMLLLTVALFFLLLAYLRHYYLLENGVQKMYTQYDKIQENKVSQQR